MQPPISAPPGAVSPDGRWIWNGMQWVPAYVSQGVSPMPMAGISPRAVGHTERRSLLAIIGGVTALVAEAVILVSYLLPYVNYDGFGSQPTYNYAVFYGCAFAQSATTCSYAPLPWGISTAGTMIVLGSAVAILLIALKGRLGIALASGALIALGIQEFSDWVAFIAAKDYPGAHILVGIAVGLFGALLLIIGGLTGGISLVARPQPVSPAIGVGLEPTPGTVGQSAQ